MGAVLCQTTTFKRKAHCTSCFVSVGKKRKQKTYTKPKKVKAVHKTVKLATLKFYSVSDDSKVQRLRKDCPICGPGVRMAVHKDRVYCGRCYKTFKIEA